MNAWNTNYLMFSHQFETLFLPLILLLGSVLVVTLVWSRCMQRRLRIREEQYRSLAEASFEAILISREGHICDCNKRAEEMTGYSRDELLGRSLYELFYRRQHSLVRQNIENDYDLPYELEGQRKDGGLYLLEVRGKTFQSGGYVMRASSLRDITQSRKEETLLRLLSAAVEHSPTSIVITDTNGIIEYVNPAFSRLTGYEYDEVIGENPRVLKTGGQPESFYKEMWETLCRGEEWRGEFHNRRKDGSLFWEMASISPVKNQHNEVSHFVAVKEDVTERKELRDRLELLAQFDMLTDLPNRRMLMDRLNQAVVIAKRNGQRFGLFFIDLDGFKRINDNYGHEAGDRVLKTVAARLSACTRSSDTAGRIGGDEFAVILGTLTHYADAGYVADKILAALCLPISLQNGVQEQVGASIGISVFPDDAQDGDSLLATADDAMYAVKKTGKNSYRYATKREHL